MGMVPRGQLAAKKVSYSYPFLLRTVNPYPGHWADPGRAILIRLIPVNLLLGRLPDPAMLRAYSLKHFSPLIHHHRTGNVAAWRQELEEKREWYRRRGIWLLLFERGEILVWRNLLRRA